MTAVWARTFPMLRVVRKTGTRSDITTIRAMRMRSGPARSMRRATFRDPSSDGACSSPRPVASLPVLVSADRGSAVSFRSESLELVTESDNLSASSCGE